MIDAVREYLDAITMAPGSASGGLRVPSEPGWTGGQQAGTGTAPQPRNRAG
jgi:hypothetical protein